MLTNDIANFLEAQGIATEGINMFRHELPTMPDTALVLAEYQSGAQADEYLSRPAMEIRARALTADTARQMVQDAENALMAQANFEVNGHKYLLIRSYGGITPLGRDDKGRIYFSQKFLILMERVI